MNKAKKKMCSARKESFPSTPFYDSRRRQQPKKKPKLQVLGLMARRRCEEKNYEGKNMELKNLKLYLENQIIVEENEKLRKKANLLHEENLALMSEFQKKFPHQLHRLSTCTLSILQKV